MSPRIRQIGATLGVCAVAVVAVAQFVLTQARSAEREREDRAASALAQSAVGSKQRVALDGLRPVEATLGNRPLDARVFLRAGLLKARAGDLAAGRDLIREAARRDPRSKPARFWLVLDALNQGHSLQALAQLDRLMAIDPQQAVAYFPVLAALAREPSALPRLQAMFAAKPVWGGDFIGYLTGQKADPGLIFALVNGPVPMSGAEAQQAALIRNLVDGRDYDRAYLTWINLLPREALAGVEPVYDGSFQGFGRNTAVQLDAYPE